MNNDSGNWIGKLGSVPNFFLSSEYPPIISPFKIFIPIHQAPVPISKTCYTKNKLIIHVGKGFPCFYAQPLAIGNKK